jgi:hypothetical protein
MGTTFNSSPMKITLSLLMLALALACTSSKQSTQTNQAIAALPQDTAYRFTVSFISKGGGIDHKAKKQFGEFIAQFNSNNKVGIEPKLVSWGREGETDYCLKLTGLNAVQQIKFIADTKELLKASNNVRYNENCTCKKNGK